MLRTDVMQDMKLSENDAFNLLVILQNYIELKNDEIKKVEADERAGKKIHLFDNYTDFLAALHASKNHAKKLLKSIQKQIGTVLIYDQVIDQL